MSTRLGDHEERAGLKTLSCLYTFNNYGVQ